MTDDKVFKHQEVIAHLKCMKEVRFNYDRILKYKVEILSCKTFMK